MSPITLAMEPRLKAAFLGIGGFPPTETLPEVNPAHYAVRVRQPLMMLNGNEDWVFPLARSARPLFEAFGTPAADKEFVEVEGTHGQGPGFEDTERVRSEFFDRQFERVQQ